MYKLTATCRQFWLAETVTKSHAFAYSFWLGIFEFLFACHFSHELFVEIFLAPPISSDTHTCQTTDTLSRWCGRSKLFLILSTRTETVIWISTLRTGNSLARWARILAGAFSSTLVCDMYSLYICVVFDTHSFYVWIFVSYIFIHFLYIQSVYVRTVYVLCVTSVVCVCLLYVFTYVHAYHIGRLDRHRLHMSYTTHTRTWHTKDLTILLRSLYVLCMTSIVSSFPMWYACFVLYSLCMSNLCMWFV